MATIMLNQDPDMVERMEKSLTDYAQEAVIAQGDLDAVVFGVFSLDDMEKLQESELAEKIAIGVGYVGCLPSHAIGGSQYNGEGGKAGKTLDFNFIILLAVPANDQLPERYSATKILSILRFFILGNTVEDGRQTRPWEFVQEKAEIADSSRTMLYYSQLWRVTVPIVSQPRPTL